jgi:hypothetical protein
MTPPDVLELVAAWRGLRATVAEHKRAIRMHREQLTAAAGALRVLEDNARRRGISVVELTAGVERISHGRPSRS